MTASSLIQHGRPAEHHLLPKKLLIKPQLSFCEPFIQNKISKLISYKSTGDRGNGGLGCVKKAKSPKVEARHLTQEHCWAHHSCGVN